MSKTVLARKLTAAGLEYHENYFNSFNEVGDRVTIVRHAPKMAVLTHPNTSEPLEFELRIPEECPADKLEMARTLVEAFGDRFIENLHNQPLWNWLTLYWFKDVVGSDFADGKTAGLNEWAVYNVYPEELGYGSSGTRIRQYRHRLWGPAFLYHQVGEAARVCLTGRISILSDVFDAVMNYNLLEQGILDTVSAMYHDDASRGLTANLKPTGRLEGEFREGAIRECLAQIGQIAATRAIHLITPEQILDALPPEEFGRHIDAAREFLGIQAPGMAA